MPFVVVLFLFTVSTNHIVFFIHLLHYSNNPVCARIVSVPITLITSAYHEYHGMISGVCLDAIQTLVTAPIQITATQTHATSSPPFLPRLPAGAFSCALLWVGGVWAVLTKEIFHSQTRKKQIPNLFSFRVCKICFTVDFVSGSLLWATNRTHNVLYRQAVPLHLSFQIVHSLISFLLFWFYLIW